MIDFIAGILVFSMFFLLFVVCVGISMLVLFFNIGFIEKFIKGESKFLDYLMSVWNY